MSTAGQWDFTLDGASILKTLNTTGGNFLPREQSFSGLSMRLVDDKIIYLYEFGLYVSAVKFQEIGLIDGDTPTSLQDAYDKLIDLIVTVFDPANYDLADFTNLETNHFLQKNVAVLGDLANVNVVGVTNGQVLVYNTATNKWIAITVSGISPTNLQTVTTGSGNNETTEDIISHSSVIASEGGLSTKGAELRANGVISFVTNDLANNADLKSDNLTAPREYQVPNLSGTLALQSEIPETATDLDALKRDGSNANQNINIGAYTLLASMISASGTIEAIGDSPKHATLKPNQGLNFNTNGNSEVYYKGDNVDAGTSELTIQAPAGRVAAEYTNLLSINNNLGDNTGNINISLPIKVMYSTTGTATTVFTVTIGVTMSDTSYVVSAEAQNLLSSPNHWITNKTTTTFDIVVVTGLTGAVAFECTVTP